MPGYEPPRKIQGTEDGWMGREPGFVDDGEGMSLTPSTGNEFAKKTTSSRACSVVRNLNSAAVVFSCHKRR